MASEVHTPNKRCHNCRRQRLRCDRSYPHCNKCVLAGKECLGYGQLFRWTGAVASRGKLAGKTSSAEVSAVPSPKQHDHDHGQDKGKGSATPSPEMTPSTLSPVVNNEESQEENWQLVPFQDSTNISLSNSWTLADPLYQDLSYSYRHYMAYCASLETLMPYIARKKLTC